MDIYYKIRSNTYIFNRFNVNNTITPKIYFTIGIGMLKYYGIHLFCVPVDPREMCNHVYCNNGNISLSCEEVNDIINEYGHLL